MNYQIIKISPTQAILVRENEYWLMRVNAKNKAELDRQLTKAEVLKYYSIFKRALTGAGL
jgi:hypothetical protein